MFVVLDLDINSGCQCTLFYFLFLFHRKDIPVYKYYIQQQKNINKSSFKVHFICIVNSIIFFLYFSRKGNRSKVCTSKKKTRKKNRHHHSILLFVFDNIIFCLLHNNDLRSITVKLISVYLSI